MAYLCKLACPPGGTLLEPFAGSGSTGQAALTAGFAALLIEREADTSQASSSGLGCPVRSLATRAGSGCQATPAPILAASTALCG